MAHGEAGVYEVEERGQRKGNETATEDGEIEFLINLYEELVYLWDLSHTPHTKYLPFAFLPSF